MYARRKAIGMARAELARILGTNEKQIQRWETQTAPPADLLINIAAGLNFSVAELIGLTPTGLDLSGHWNAVWQTSRDGVPLLNRHSLEARHNGEFVYFDADGDYDWRADFRLVGSTLNGSYAAVAEHRNERGMMHLTLNHHGGTAAIGHWAGEWADGIGGVGFGVIARDPERAERLMKKLLELPSLMITEWPQED